MQLCKVVKGSVDFASDAENSKKVPCQLLYPSYPTFEKGYVIISKSDGCQGIC